MLIRSNLDIIITYLQIDYKINFFFQCLGFLWLNRRFSYYMLISFRFIQYLPHIHTFITYFPSITYFIILFTFFQFTFFSCIIFFRLLLFSKCSFRLMLVQFYFDYFIIFYYFFVFIVPLDFIHNFCVKIAFNFLKIL